MNRRDEEEDTYRKGTKNAKAEIVNEDELLNGIMGAAIEVHRQLGPGLLESAYETCLAYEL